MIRTLIRWDEDITEEDNVTSINGHKVIYKDKFEIDIDLIGGETFVIPLVEEERNLVENILMLFGFQVLN